ncbi:BQ2448_7502 [Microbotryum intermedium]|uniref:BQ2448_7502 protein n=1 Tax=Microbotryum intermedium TaxID=269621 RepID=A0A238FR51_9BASI|nr:BQ2448_7502 [Microbotryum intermedium]
MIYPFLLLHHQQLIVGMTSDSRSSSSPSTPTQARPSAGASTAPFRRSKRLANFVVQHDTDSIVEVQALASTPASTSNATSIHATSASSPPVSADVPIPSSPRIYHLAGLREALPDRDRDHEPEPAAPSASGSSYTSLSTPLQPQRAPSSGERAKARADRIFKAVKMKQVFSPALEAYFFDNPTSDEFENKIWPTAKIGTEVAMAEVIEAINRIVSQAGSIGCTYALVACKNSPNYIDVAPDRVETTEKTADIVLLTRASFAHDPTLSSVWALPNYSKPDVKGDGEGNGNGNVYVNVNSKNTDEDDEEEQEDDNDDDEEAGEDKDKDTTVDLNQTKRSLTHVAAVGQTKAGGANAEKQLFRRLSALLATPIREYAVGFTLRGDSLKVYIMNACGVFFTIKKKVTETNGFLSTFLYRLVRHTDPQNGLLATTTSLDDRYGPFTLCEGFFPRRPPNSLTECGRATSTYKITVRDGTNFKTHAMTIAWVEESRNSDLAEIRNFIQEESPRGLSRLVGVFRGEYETLHAFLDTNQTFDKLVPRAREVVIHEQCYESLDTLTNTKQLARVLEGAIHGHRALWDRGFIHRDVSHGNVMVDREVDGSVDGVLIDYHLAVKKARLNEDTYRLSRSGTLPYLSRPLLKVRPEGVVHERWHDIESFFYVASYTAFRSPSSTFGALIIEKSEAARIWNVWNAEDSKGAAKDKDGLRGKVDFRDLIQACASRWVGMEELLGILKRNCSLYAWVDIYVPEEEAHLGALWGLGTMGYERIFAGLKEFHESF